MKFLKLHSVIGSVIRVNFDLIETYVKGPESMYTSLVPIGCKDNDDCYLVEETPEQIDEMLGELNE